MILPPNASKHPRQSMNVSLSPAETIALNALAIRVAKMLMEGTATPHKEGHYNATHVAFVIAAVTANLARYADKTPGGDGEAFIADMLVQLSANRRAYFAGEVTISPMERFNG